VPVVPEQRGGAACRSAISTMATGLAETRATTEVIATIENFMLIERWIDLMFGVDMI
jgi:hypothetical protein